MTNQITTMLELAAAPVRALNPYDPGHDPTAVKQLLGRSTLCELGSNENPFGPAPGTYTALAEHASMLCRYPDAGARVLKQALAQRYQCDPAGFCIGNGSHELLVQLAQTFVCPDDEVVYSQYGFAVFGIAARQTGARSVVVPALPSLGTDVDALCRAFTSKTKLVYLANPNNPTGSFVSASGLEQILSALPMHALLVIDEAYFEYCDRAMLPDAASYLSAHPRLVVTRTFSKAYALAGLRLGYLMADPAICAVLERTRLSFNGNLLALVAGSAALDDQVHMRTGVAATLHTRAWLAEALQTLGLTVYPSQGNFVLVDFGRPASPIEDALLQRGILVRPMGGYGLPQCSRITAGLATDAQELIVALRDLL